MMFSLGAVPRFPGPDKSSAYECGFDPYATTRIEFDIKFKSTALLFLVFDLELVMISPFALVFSDLSAVGVLSFSLFFLLLTLGYLYEWHTGSFDW